MMIFFVYRFQPGLIILQKLSENNFDWFQHGRIGAHVVCTRWCVDHKKQSFSTLVQ